MMMQVSVGRLLLKSTVIATVLNVFSSRFLWLHKMTNCSTSHLYADSSPFWMRPLSVVSSANFRSLTDSSPEVQLLVKREKSSVESIHPCWLSGCWMWFSPVSPVAWWLRKFVIRLKVEAGTVSWVSLEWGTSNSSLFVKYNHTGYNHSEMYLLALPIQNKCKIE